ncbi:MAG: hypothetical protein L3J61_01350, partial [Ghiorsea sp.]|nr:hypothetical protein [Ghiorsea sp.]
IYIDYNKNAELESYQGEVKTYTGKIIQASYAGQRNFFGVYHNYITFEDGVRFHLISQEAELFCKGDTLNVTYPVLYDEGEEYLPSFSHSVEEKGSCGEIQVKNSRVTK